MPTYTFADAATGEIVSIFMSMSEHTEFVLKNPTMVQVPAAVATIDPIRAGVTKPTRDFRERLGEISASHDRIFTRSTINTQ